MIWKTHLKMGSNKHFVSVNGKHFFSVSIGCLPAAIGYGKLNT